MNYCVSSTSTLLPEAEAQRWTGRASRLIDRLTMGRAAVYAEALQEELDDACIQIAELLYLQSQAQVNSRGGLLSGANNDGYSESYATGTTATGHAAQARVVLAAALGADEYGLLYRGVGLC